MPKRYTFLELKKLLQENDWEIVRQRGSHVYFRHSATGKIVVVPNHGKNMKTGTVAAILRHIGLKK